jgi:general secretion pathway protein F
MAAFRFEAVDPRGTLQQGTLEADSARAARGVLRAQGLTAVSVAAIEAHGKAGQRTRRYLSAAQLTNFTRQFASLIAAGLPLDEALAVLAEQWAKRPEGELIASIRAEVVAGQTLARALAAHPRDFSELYGALIAAAEQSGKLAMVMERLADYLDASLALRQKVQLAFAYPAVVSTVALGIVLLLMTYVVPQVVNVFANAHQHLPLLTVALIAVSSWLRRWGIVAAIVCGGLAIATRAALKRATVRVVWHRWLLSVPLVGTLARDYDTVRFVSTLAILSDAQVPILRALDAAIATLNNTALRSDVAKAQNYVREGAPLSRALAATHVFEPAVVHLVRSGESTGEVAAMLNRAATTGARELERKTLLLTSLLEPLLILAMGGFVLGIVLAIMMPIIEINQLVR